MIRYYAFAAAMLLATAAWADGEKSYVDSVFEKAKVEAAAGAQKKLEDYVRGLEAGAIEVARQRDEAIEQRDYFANRSCDDRNVMRFPFRSWIGDISPAPDIATVLEINEGADSKTEYTVIHSVPPSISICVLKVGEECALKYDGETQSFITTRPWIVKVGGKP